MPEKDGDEGKSTKSVVNKKQKQMMGEEGYDIARDMGRVRPSKDKKDATTMPPSKEMEKTRKVYKGPSAFERVKAKYGKSVMNVGKKKVKEELDLTKVAEAFGGYIIEGKVEDEKKKADAQFKKDFADSLKRKTVTQKALPLYKAGGPFVPDKTVDAKTGKKVEPMVKKPYFGRPSDPKNPEDRGGIPDNTERYERRQRRKEEIPPDTGAGDPKEVKKTKKQLSDFSNKLKALRKKVDASKQSAVDIDTEKFFKEVEKQKRKEKGIENLKKAIKTGTTKSGESIDKIDREGTRDISTMNPSERERAFGASGSTEGGAGGEGPKRQDQVVKFKQTPSAKKAGEQASKEAQGASSQIDPSQRIFASRKRGESGAIPYKELVKQANNVRDTEVVDSTPFDNQKIEPKKPKKQKPTITRSRKRVDKGFAPPPTPKEPSALAKAVEKTRDFAKKEPVAALATYDLGKGVLGKILKVKSLLPGVRGGTVGRRSARGGGGL